ncbi:hypothetical protein [Mesorhizobium argentiipisi]|uniref:Uncharacterized protein n=1 Tax=Mesorhizobium argentiipisi TaxID=3015175 RepID=A0ABU8KCV9_9HYPH
MPYVIDQWGQPVLISPQLWHYTPVSESVGASLTEYYAERTRAVKAGEVEDRDYVAEARAKRLSKEAADAASNQAKLTTHRKRPIAKGGWVRWP